MVVKTLQVFFGGDCLPYKDREHKVHYPIVTPAFQGASQVNEIKFYVDYIGGSMLKWLAVAKLPNGRVGMKLLDFAEDELGTYVTLTLTQWFTQAKGDLYVSLKGFDGESDIVYDEETGLYHISGEPIVQATGSVKITIQYATPIDDEDYGDITIQELIGYINTKLDKNSEKYFKVIDDILNINSAEYADYLKGGDIVYSKSADAIYVLYGTYPTLTYEKLLDFGEIVLTSNVEQFISGMKWFIGGKIGLSGPGTLSNTGNFGTLKWYTSSDTPHFQLAGNPHGSLDFCVDGKIVGTAPTLPYAVGIETYLKLPAAGSKVGDIITYETLATQEWTITQINEQIAKVYQPQGDATVSELNGLTKTSSMNGYVYNMSDGGTLINSDNTTLTVQEGDNVAFIWNEWLGWKWDNLKGIVDLSNYVTLNTEQIISGQKTFNGNIAFIGSYISFASGISSSLVPYQNNSYAIGSNFSKWNTVYTINIHGDSFNFATDKAYQILYGFNATLSGFNTSLSYESVNTIAVGQSGTFTLYSAPAGCLPEYHGTITNSSQTAITLTFTGVSTILSNDDNLTITNSANSTLTLPASTTIEFNIFNGKMVAINFAAE